MPEPQTLPRDQLEDELERRRDLAQAHQQVAEHFEREAQAIENRLENQAPDDQDGGGPA